MEEILLRFPHLSEKIFNLLDNNGLEKSKEVDKYWNVYIAKQKFYSIRIIKTTMERFQKVGPEWETLFVKSTRKTIRDLQKVVQLFYLEQNVSQGARRCTIYCSLDEQLFNKYPSSYRSLNIPSGITPLHIAAYSDDLDLLKTIFERNLENKKDDWGCTPLHYAAHNGHFEMCRYIMQIFDDMNTGNKFGETPLHEAANHGHLEICKILVKNLLDNNPADISGWTPFHCAALQGHLGVCDFFMSIIKNKTPHTKSGLFPLFLAADNGHTDICELIMKKLDNQYPTVNTAGLLYRQAISVNCFHPRGYEYQCLWNGKIKRLILKTFENK